MSTIVVSGADYAAVFRKTESARMQRVNGAPLEPAMEGAETVVVPAAIAAGKDTGRLASSIEAKRIARIATIVVDAPYAGIIEAGARPHWAPLQPLLDWVNRHLQAFDVVKPKGRRVGIGAAQTARAQRNKDRKAAAWKDFDAEVMAIACAIRAKIAKEGSKPHWFMKNSLPKLREILKATVEKRIRD